MKIDILSLFPDMFNGAFTESIIKRAVSLNKVEINVHNFRDYTVDLHNKVDDTPYGGGCGMVLSCQPIFDCVESLRDNDCKVILLTPDGVSYKQKMAYELSSCKHLILICGHYEGFDERIRILSKAREVSIGDFVLSGGEYSAICIIDAVTRLLDGTLGNSESKDYDSHSEYLLEYPQYTKPRDYEGLEVPEILLGGNHEKIAEWRRIKQFERTKEKRPDLFEKFLKTDLSKSDKKLLKEID